MFVSGLCCADLTKYEQMFVFLLIRITEWCIMNSQAEGNEKCFLAETETLVKWRLYAKTAQKNAVGAVNVELARKMRSSAAPSAAKRSLTARGA